MTAMMPTSWRNVPPIARGVLLVGLIAVLCTVAAPAWSYADAYAVGRTARDVQSDGTHGKLVLVLDSSGSMKERLASGETRIDAARRALHHVVDELPAEANVGMRVFGATVFSRDDPGACEDSQLVVPIGPVDKPRLRQAIAKYKPYGETPISYSLQQAAKDVGSSGERSIVLVTDGEETCNADPCAVARSIHEKGINLTIDVVGFNVGGAAEQKLRRVADAGGGTYYHADTAEELADSLAQPALRAFRPFAVTGTPVEGARRRGEATEVGPGQYTDELGGTAEPTGVKYFAVPRMDGSSVHVGFTAYPPSQSDLKGYNDAVSLTLQAPDGTECGRTTGLQMQAGTRQILVASVSYIPELDPDNTACAGADRLVLEVRRGGLDGYTGPAPDKGTVPYEFLVIEEPALADAEGLPEPLAEGSTPSTEPVVQPGRPMGEVAGGGGFAQAATVGPGTWTDSIQPGEVLFYRVRADWGQTPRVSFTIQPDAHAEEVIGSYGVYADVQAFGPNRVALHKGDLVTIVPSRASTLTSSLLEVRYRNRESGLGWGDSNPSAFALPGYYYFVVTMANDGPGLGSVEPGSAELPMQISVALDGEPAGAPHYQAPPAAEPGTDQPVDSDEDDVSAPADGDDSTASGQAGESTDGSALVPVAVGSGLGLVALAGLLVVMTLPRRRRSGNDRIG